MICDVKQDDGIWFLLVHETDDDGTLIKLVENATSARRVPLHEELIRIGFLNMVENRRVEAPGGFLFPKLTPDPRTENRGKVLGQWFGRLRRSAVERRGKFGKDLHSLRRSVTDRLRAISSSDEMRYALLGWIDGGQRRNSGFDYGRGFPMRDLKKIVDKIEFPGFDSTFLHSTDEGMD